MRNRNTYRATRRNVARGQTVLLFQGDNWKTPFNTDQIKYTPPETSGYWPNREDLKHAGKLEPRVLVTD